MSDPPPLLPPPAPPLPPTRAAQVRHGVLQRLVGPLGFGMGGTRPHIAQTEADARPDPVRIHTYAPLPSQTAVHRTGIPIAALDISPDKTRAILAGKGILKTVRIEDNKVTEEFNLRSAINSYASTHNPADSESRSAKRADFLPSGDVKWSHGSFDSIIATAANHGRIALYDLHRPEVEHAWLREHTRSVHRLAFNPHQGYYLLSASQDATVKAWDLRSLAGERSAMTMKSFRQFQGRADAVRDVRWSPTDAFEFTLCTDGGAIQTWDIRNTSGPRVKINGHEKACTSVDYHPDGRHIISAGFDRYVRVFDLQRDRRQKPSFSLRTPQPVTNIRWRPPCWSSEMQGNGDWQSTQFAVSYTQEDPRVHIYDLRRQDIPFRELDRYNSSATDLLWASKDLLWTVGNEGMFTQTDVTFAPQVHHEISPCAMAWFPNGDYAVFAEDRGVRRGSGHEDPAVGFLNIRQEKLSSGEQAAIERDSSDDEDDHDGFFTSSFRRRQSRAASSRSAKSRTNSPPYKDDLLPVLPLDKAVFERNDLFQNKQVGYVSETTGVAVDPPVVEYLAQSYARPLTEAERNKEPGLILERLEGAFRTNAEASDYVAMYRLGQSWRILSAVIIAELKDWADRNRKSRIENAKAMLQKEETKSAKKPLSAKGIPVTKPVISYASDLEWWGGRTDVGTTATNNFRPFKKGKDMDSTSGMTTPLARPLPDSPLADQLESGYSYYSLEDAMETVPPLSPSVVASHSTAAAASKALKDDAENASDTPPSSPEASRNGGTPSRTHRRTHTTDSVPSTSSWLQPSQSEPQAIQGRSPNRRSYHGSPKPPVREADRRAALRDYRPPTRPLLTLQEPLDEDSASRPSVDFRHDSTESFPMFSVSTDSSQKEKSFGNSSESPESKRRNSTPTEGWLDCKDSFEPSSPPSDESGKQGNLSRLFGTSRMDVHVQPTFAMDDAPSPRPDPNGRGTDSGGWGNSTDSRPTNLGRRQADLSVSSSVEEPFQFEEPELKLQASRQYLSPTYRQPPLPTLAAASNQPVSVLQKAPHKIFNDSSNYIASDFSPIDLSAYKPPTPIAWSALSLIAHAIDFDLESGQACGQFSAHLLMHMHPFFFHQKYRRRKDVPPGLPFIPPQTVADKLMNPSYSERVIESIFLNHFLFLKKIRLFVPMAELGNICVEFEYPHIYKLKGPGGEKAVLNSGDAYAVAITCANCYAPLQNGASLCQRCRKIRDPCPICLSRRYDNRRHQRKSNGVGEGYGDQGMWTFCQSCGHSAHTGCMEMWLACDYSEGQCPSGGCACDCGPGAVRRERIRKQIVQEQDLGLVKGRSGSPRVKEGEKRERVVESRAVERTRRVLREGERGTQSGGEETVRRRASTHVNGSGSGSGGPSQGLGLGLAQSSKKVVRLMTPGEESTTRKESG